MQFLTDSDLYNVIEKRHLEQILPCDSTSGEAVKDYVEQTSITTVKEYLSSVYDIDHELEQTGSDRSNTLITILLDLFKYEFFQKENQGGLNQVIADRYDRAIQRLKNGNKGVITFYDIKTLNTGENQENLPFRWGCSQVSDSNSY